MKAWMFRSKEGSDLSKKSDTAQDSSAGAAAGQLDQQVSTRDATAVPERPFPGAAWGSMASPGKSGRPSKSAHATRTGEGGFMSALQNMTRGGSQSDAEMERRVSLAARNLGDGVQKIVLAAKGTGRQEGGAQGEWKSELLKLLGDGDDEGGKSESDIDVLLENSSCEKFVLRCVENELPPNLIHCLRLLRVLELQRASAQQQEDQNEEMSSVSISTEGTAKVSKLLCLLCKDPSVGEQLRPHLFGLLALSGASYPASGVHVANAASAVIIAFSEFCLSDSLVSFLHERKMIVHMTDDIKELCGMSDVSSSTSASLCLYGNAAEEAGLWVVALKTVVNLVAFSCNYQCIELLNDFDGAGGYHVLCYAIANSRGDHARQLMELVTTLACCKTDSTPSAATPSGADDTEGGEKADAKLVTNPAACDIIEDLMVRSVPLLKEFDKVYGGERPEISSEESLRELATFSLRTALNVRFAGTTSTTPDFDLAMELLVSTLQLYSDHAKNYDVVEERHNILSYYLLAFPTFEDVSLKVLILKTLEYVCTGVAGNHAVRPLSVTSEIFFALCKSLLKGANGIELDSDEEAKIYESLMMDADMMCGTIEKLLEFDTRVSEVMLDGGILTSKLNDVLDLVEQATESRKAEENGTFEADGRIFSLPPASTPLDRVFAAICRVLKLVVVQQSCVSPPISAKTDGKSEPVSDMESTGSNVSKLHVLLLTAVTDLGDDASAAALGVFDSMMGAEMSLEILSKDMEFMMEVLDYFAEMAGRLGGLPEFSLASNYVQKRSIESTEEAENGQMTSYAGVLDARVVDPNIVLRMASVFTMFGSVLEANDIAKDVFRTSGGFECIVRAVLCLDGIANKARFSGMTEDGALEELDNRSLGEADAADCDDAGAKAVIELLESAFGLLGAALGKSRKQSGGAGDASLSSLAMDVLTEESTTQLLSFSGPTASNRQYLHQRRFYVDFAAAISGTGILNTARYARSVLNLALAYMDPSLVLRDIDGEEKRGDSSEQAVKPRQIRFIRNPDASRLVMGLSTCLPPTDFGVALSKRALDELLRLCGPEMAGTTLSQLASCGLCWSVTNTKEFARMLEDRSHHLYSRFVLLLRRIAAFSMSYTDFVELLRCIAGPMLRGDLKDAPDQLSKRIRLPVISSSVRTTTTQPQMSQDVIASESWKTRETEFCARLETLCVLAERGDRTPRCEVGGDSLNTIALYMQNVRIEDRLYTLAGQGRLKFLEIKSIDASALTSTGSTSAGTAATSSSSGAERIWTPLASSGFTYSIWLRIKHSGSDNTASNLFMLDISSPPADRSGIDGSLSSAGAPNHGGGSHKEFLSVWYDLQTQRFNVLSSASHRNEPACFPVSPLRSGVWHHVVLAYLPPKRPMLSRKAALGMFVDGRPLEDEVRVESANLPPNARVHIGVPNPVLASSGILRGSLPQWDLGPTLLLSTLLSIRDATAIFTAGPEFQGMFWGDRPQRLSLTATATTAFAMLAECGEQGSVAGALRRRGVPQVEGAGHAMRERTFGGGPAQGPESDSLDAVGLLCVIPPDCIVFGFRAASSSGSMRDGLSSSKNRHFSRRLVNLARINYGNETVSTDAIVYGNGSVVSPHCFADNVQWASGPNVLMPLVNAARSARSLALALRLIRESVHHHPPNLEMLQAGGGYRMLGVLLRQKRIMDESVLDQSLAFAVHGFEPESSVEQSGGGSTVAPTSWPSSDRWVFADLHAMKYLLLNHQVWDMQGSGPDLPLRLLSFLNGLVAQNSAHKAFNSRRLHLLGIVRWTLHLMMEAAELYTASEVAASAQQTYGDSDGDQFSSPSDAMESPHRSTETSVGNTQGASAIGADALSNGWSVKAPSVASVAVGGDPDNVLLQGCKTLLRRVLTFMLTPGDLEAIAEAAIYTVSITGSSTKGGGAERNKRNQENDDLEVEQLMPGPVARVYLLRLIEELVVDGVNEIVTAGSEKKRPDSDGQPEPAIEPHAGGGASTNPSYSVSPASRRRRQGADGSVVDDFDLHPKHQQAQAFLQAFGGVLTPVWFACLLEGCHEEASASAVLRLMILMLQSSPMFAAAFEEAGGFAPLVLSIPKFSTCPAIIMSMLSQLLHAPILHLPCFGAIDAAQLCEVFDAESDATELIIRESVQGGVRTASDPSCGIFALLAECLGRNIQLAPTNSELGRKARRTNLAVLQLLSHRHKVSSAFQKFCQSSDFLEPLAQALCLVHDEKMHRTQQQEEEKQEATCASDPQVQAGKSRRGSLSGVPKDETPTERFVGRPEEEVGSSGIGMVQLLHLVVSHAVLSGPLAAPLVNALFRSFPIHASSEQVEAFHLVLIEHCRSVVEEALQRNEPVALANCIGVSSVLLDRLMAGFFTSEPVLEAVSIALSSLSCLTTSSSGASRTWGNTEQNMLSADAAHIARLTCLTALQRSRPIGPYDDGDEDLKRAVLDIIGQNLQSLLLVPTGSGNPAPRIQSIMGGGGPSNTSFPTPPPGSKMHPLWQSSSLARCCPPSTSCAYPDLSVMQEPDRCFVVGLMDELHLLLLDPREEMRDKAVSIVVALLQQRREIMSELLIAESPSGDRTETIDVMNRGGFGALLVAHEAATIAENVSTVPRRGSDKRMPVSKRKYASFFEWLERNQSQVDAVFKGIHIQATRLLPGAEMGASTPEEAIENEQKVMLLKLTSQDSSDRTILGGLERAELAQRCYDKTAESHALWKRQGFDDLSSGAMQWKFLLRQLKGSCSLWEGGMIFDDDSPFSSKRLLTAMLNGKKSPTKKEVDGDGSDKAKMASLEVVRRWKLDLTEGYERQRRRLLPNYEFHGLYNLDETADNHAAVSPADDREAGDSDEDSVDSAVISNLLSSNVFGDVAASTQHSRKSLFVPAESMEATAALLKDLNLKRGSHAVDDDFFDVMEDMDVDDENEALTADTSVSTLQDSASVSESIATKDDSSLELSSARERTEEEARLVQPGDEDEVGAQADADESSSRQDNVFASSYDVITGLLHAGDWPEKSYNVNRCTGLEVRKGLLLWCREAIYIIDGFEQTDGEGLEGKINRLEKESSTFYINLRPQDFKVSEGTSDAEKNDNVSSGGADSKRGANSGRNRAKEATTQDSSEEEVTYQHRSQRIAFNDLYSVFRRRYQLQQIALEVYDVHRSGTLIAFSSNADREEVLSKILSCPLPNSIFSISGFGSSINYKKFMNSWKYKITTQWVNGKLTNFDFLMHLNSFAGRTYNDLTQYPVFPWVIADYESEEIDLNNPATYRDLSQPMGAQGEARATQFRDRYEALEASYCNEDDPPPFHYGTHYSCAAYVLYYLMRLEPFSRLALSLQGGRFDVADRLFHNIGSSWRSASTENLQDVREVIPEFFYLPEFLVNSNSFDFGTTQTGKTVHDVSLPPWAKGDPERFIRINRLALESEYVSKNLHNWVDLVFGYKQRGREAIAALNTFVHVTYEGAVDLEAMKDPIQRESTIAQIQNFGQTPSRLERKPFPQRVVAQALRDKNVDFGALTYLTALTPPFCIVGAPIFTGLRVAMIDTCKLGMAGQNDSAVGDMMLVKGQIIGVGHTCSLIVPEKRYYRFGGPNNGVSVHVASTTSRYRELNKMISIHDGMHRAPISVAKASLNGMWLVTGCMDSTVRVWRYGDQKMDLRATLCGHEGGQVTCIDISTVFGTIVTGCAVGNVNVWDLRTLTFIRRLRHPFKDAAETLTGVVSRYPAVAVSINHHNGNIVTLVGSHLSVFDINGKMLATQGPGEVFIAQNRPSCVVATDCAEWMKESIVAITGHVNGDVRLWGLDYDNGELLMRHLMHDKPHSCPVTAMRVCGDRQDTLLVGDKSGRMSVCKTLQLENLSPQLLEEIVAKLRSGVPRGDIHYEEKKSAAESSGWIGL